MKKYIDSFVNYRFLLSELVKKGIKLKYRRSYLGIIWSLLEPLCTMIVLTVVFGTILGNRTKEFSVYILCGRLLFSFYSTATKAALTSIRKNASMIKKVYVPKYIYPVSKVLSSSVNLLLSLIPLIFVMVFSGVPVRPAILLLPFGLLCLLCFCVGMGFLLSTLMVFFRDMQFLWSVLSMLWMYLTPVFYPESIIPEQFMMLYKCNPLYHILRFFRGILIDGVSPAPKAYLYCLIASAVPLVIGAAVFKSKQDKFILNL